ncbi:MAG: tetratricopeptide repeat protein [Phototrophicaceae bacterium]
MIRLPRTVFIPMLISLFFIGFIAARTNMWVGIGAFVFFIGVPSFYFISVYYLGTAMTIRGDIRGAIAHYSRIINANERFKIPVNRVFLHTQRAALRNALGDLDGAIGDYTDAMRHSKQDVPALYGIRSALYLGKRDYEHALDDSNMLLKLQPQSEIGYANRAAAKMFLGDVVGAISDCTQGLDHVEHLSGSGKALLYNNRGTAYRIQGEYEEAMSNYNLAMSAALKPQQQKLIHPSVMTNQGILYYLMQEVESARVYFQQALDKNPSFHKAIAGLALSRFRLDQVTEARKLWKDLIALEPRYRDIRTLQHDMNLPNQMMGDVAELVDVVTH